MEERRQDHAARSRYLRTVEPVSFSSEEMLSGILSALCPSKVSSVCQLHGDRKDVVRVTFTSCDAAAELDAKVATRKLRINGVRVAEVKDTGSFTKVVLLDVPDYLSSSDLEAELLAYGSVAYIKRDYHEFDGYRLDSEVRHVFFTSLDRQLPKSISIDGNDIFVTSKCPQPARVRAEKDNRLVSNTTSKTRTTRSRPASPAVVAPPREESLYSVEKPPAPLPSATTTTTSVTSTTVTKVRRPVSPQSLSLDVVKIANGPMVSCERNSGSVTETLTSSHAQRGYTEIIDSPHGTLPRRIHTKVREVVESPVEEVKRNLSPYMERHQLRLQSPGGEDDGDPEVILGNRKHDDRATSSASRKRSPAASRRRREPPRDESSSGPEQSV